METTINRPTLQSENDGSVLRMTSDVRLKEVRQYLYEPESDTVMTL